MLNPSGNLRDQSAERQQAMQEKATQEAQQKVKKLYKPFKHLSPQDFFINKGKIPDIRKTNWKRQLFAKLWSKLPLFIANKFGPKLRKEFP